MQELPEGFIKWHGEGYAPVDHGFVDVITRGGERSRSPMLASKLWWGFNNVDADIIAYRPAPMQYDPDDVAFTSGIKHDQGKPRFDLIPALAESEIAKVLAYGAEKYSAENWRFVENAGSRYLAAAKRHINQWQQGEEIDKESNLHHLAHAITGLMFILELELER